MKKSKITRSHSTSIETTKPFLFFAQNDKRVKKISLGIIKSINYTGPKRLKCKIEPACLFVSFRGNRAIQEIRFFTADVTDLKKEIEALAQKEGFQI